MFVNDRNWNLQQARNNRETQQWHLKRSADAARRGDILNALSHSRTAAIYGRTAEQYERSARMCTK